MKHPFLAMLFVIFLGFLPLASYGPLATSTEVAAVPTETAPLTETISPAPVPDPQQSRRRHGPIVRA